MQPANETPLYVSQPTAKSIWQEYRLYADRLEIDSVPWGLVKVPLSDIRQVTLRPPMMVLDVFRGDYGLRELLRTVKLDMSDLAEHVAIEKTGFWKQIRITPHNPEEFKQAVDAALAAARR